MASVRILVIGESDVGITSFINALQSGPQSLARPATTSGPSLGPPLEAQPSPLPSNTSPHSPPNYVQIAATDFSASSPVYAFPPIPQTPPTDSLSLQLVSRFPGTLFILIVSRTDLHRQGGVAPMYYLSLRCFV